MGNKTVYPFGTDGQLPSSIGVIDNIITGGVNQALSANMGVGLGSMIGSVKRRDMNYAYIFRKGANISDPPVDDPNGTRMRICFPVNIGTHLHIDTTWENGFFAGVWDSLYLCASSASASATQLITLNSYQNGPIDADINVDGYLCVSLKPSPDGTITDAIKAQILSSINIILTESNWDGKSINDVVGGLEEDIHFLNFPLPNFVKGTASSSGNARAVPASNENARAVIKDLVVLPYAGCTLHFKIPTYYFIGIRFYNGYDNTDAAYGGAWYKNGDTLTPDKKYSHFMCYLAHTIDGENVDNNYNFDVDAVNTLLANGEISVQYANETGDVIQRMLASGQQLKSTMVRYSSNKDYNTQGAMPTFVHCSDIHGDAIRWRNVVEVATHIGAIAVIDTGDSVTYHVENGMSFHASIVSDLMSKIPIICSVGNHDTHGDSTYRASLNTNLYNNVIKPFEDSAGYSLPSSSDYEDAPTYYYRDFASQKIRVITLNLYDKGVRTWEYNALSQKQINWLISTLASTPTNYGVMICYHRSCGAVVKDDNYEKFWQVSSTAGYAPSTWQLNGVNGSPILDIIDAFIARTTLSSTFTQSISGNITQTITISADFTSLNNGVEFIAHVFGHHHRDTIGYYNSTQKQLVLCVCQTTSAYSSQHTTWANPSDLPRFGGGKEQDAFNVYTIDRDAKTVRVAKFGSTLSSETLEPRDYMVIPYAD